MQIEEPLVPALQARKPRALVDRDPAPNESAELVDWSAWYLTDEEDVGESVELWSILWQLLSALGQLAVERDWKNVLWAGDNFFAWVPSEPFVRVSPDAYLLDDPPPHPRPRSWQTWLPGHHPPRWAVEVVSEEWKKDYEDNPPKYAQLGARELVIFDPEAKAGDERSERPPRAVRQSPTRVRLQIYRRGPDGAFMLAYRGDGPAWCEEIEAFLVVVDEAGAPRLRIARDPDGKDLVPTAEERALIEAEGRRAEAEGRRAAEEKVRLLEAELAKLRGG